MQKTIYLKLYKKLEQQITLFPKKYQSWIKKYLFNNRWRYLSDIKIIESINANGKILEIGSFPGHLTFLLSALGADVTGIDLNPRSMNKFIRVNRLKIKKCNIEKQPLPFKNNQFDLVIFNEVLEHLAHNPIFALREIHRVLKKDGKLILSTPNFYSFFTIIRLLKGEGINDIYDVFRYQEKLGYIEHIREYSTKEVKKLLAKIGFKTTGVYYKSYYFYCGNLRQNIQRAIINFIFKIAPYLRPYQVTIAKKNNSNSN